jgi:hypothetical protein
MVIVKDGTENTSVIGCGMDNEGDCGGVMTH